MSSNQMVAYKVLKQLEAEFLKAKEDNDPNLRDIKELLRISRKRYRTQWPDAGTATPPTIGVSAGINKE